MIIPVRCFSCGKVLADKWTFYKKECSRLIEKARRVAESKKAAVDDEEDIESGGVYQGAGDAVVVVVDGDAVSRAEIFDRLHLDRMCCRRHLLGHVDLMDKI